MEIPVKLLVKLRRFFFVTVRPSMDGPQEETLELPGGRKQAPTLQVLEHHSIFFWFAG